MNVLLLTMNEPMYMPRYLEPVLAAQKDAINEIVIAPHPGEDLTTTVRQRYEMFGPVAFGQYGIRYTVGKALGQLPTAVQRRVTGRYHSIQSVATAFDIPVRVEEDINREGFVDHVRNQDIDLILSIACGQKLGSELLSLPEEGCINLHGSLLPNYRGRATAFWVLYHDEECSGVTAHYMSTEFDAGDIVLQKRFPIADDDTMHEVYNKIVETGAEVAIETIDAVEAGDVTTKPNPADEGTYRSLPDAEDRREFKRRGNRFR